MTRYITLTTIGLGDFFPSTTAGRVGLVVFAMFGLGLLATVLELIEGLLIDAHKARLDQLEKRRKVAVDSRHRLQAAANAPLA